MNRQRYSQRRLLGLFALAVPGADRAGPPDPAAVGAFFDPRITQQLADKHIAGTIDEPSSDAERPIDLDGFAGLVE